MDKTHQCTNLHRRKQSVAAPIFVVWSELWVHLSYVSGLATIDVFSPEMNQRPGSGAINTTTARSSVSKTDTRLVFVPLATTISRPRFLLAEFVIGDNKAPIKDEKCWWRMRVAEDGREGREREKDKRLQKMNASTLPPRCHRFNDQHSWF